MAKTGCWTRIAWRFSGALLPNISKHAFAKCFRRHIRSSYRAGVRDSHFALLIVDSAVPIRSVFSLMPAIACWMPSRGGRHRSQMVPGLKRCASFTINGDTYRNPTSVRRRSKMRWIRCAHLAPRCFQAAAGRKSGLFRRYWERLVAGRCGFAIPSRQ